MPRKKATSPLFTGLWIHYESTSKPLDVREDCVPYCHVYIDTYTNSTMSKDCLSLCSECSMNMKDCRKGKRGMVYKAGHALPFCRVQKHIDPFNPLAEPNHPCAGRLHLRSHYTHYRVQWLFDSHPRLCDLSRKLRRSGLLEICAKILHLDVRLSPLSLGREMFYTYIDNCGCFIRRWLERRGELLHPRLLHLGSQNLRKEFESFNQL